MTRSDRALIAASVAALVTYGALVVAGSASGSGSHDFTAYWAVTRALLRTGWSGLPHLYDAACQHRAERGLASPGALPALPFVNPPIVVGLVLAVSWLGSGPGLLVWDGLGLAALVAAAVWLSAPQGLRDPRIAVVLFAGAGVPTLSALGEGQVDLFLPLAVAVAAAGVRRHRWAQVALATAVCSVKPELFLGWLVPATRRSQRWAVGVAAGSLALVALASALVLGGHGLAAFVALNRSTLTAHFLPTRDSTILGELWSLVGGGTGTEVAAAALSLVGLVVMWWGWGRRPPRTPTEWRLALSMTTCGSLLLAPHLLAHDLVLLVVPAAWVARSRFERGQSLWPVVAWTAAIDLAAVWDTNTATASLPVRAVPLVLLAATWACWHALGARSAGSPHPLPAVAVAASGARLPRT